MKSWSKSGQPQTQGMTENERILEKANRAFRSRDYGEAVSLYESFKSRYPSLSHIAEWNIAAVERARRSTVADSTAEPSISINAFFDRIYLVNLESNVADRLKRAKHLRRYGIKYQLWRATSGWQDEPLKKFREAQLRTLGTLKRFPEFNEIEFARGKPFIESQGAVGYIYTYASILQNAIEEGLNKILILEDDVTLHPDFLNRFKQFMSAISSDWKVIQLGASQYNWQSVDIEEAERCGFYAPRCLHTCGSFALGLSSDVFQHLREAALSFEAPFDHLPLGEIYEQHQQKCFVCYPNLVMPDVRTSSIRGSRDQYKHGHKMRWKVAEFEFPLTRMSVAVIANRPFNLQYLPNFSNRLHDAIDLRVFISSEDGLRPVHTLGTEQEQSVRPTFDSAEVLPEADLHVTVDPDAVLTESSIVGFVEYKLGLREKCPAELSEAAHAVVHQIQPGRVSVIIPTYRRPIHLEHAAGTAIVQEYPDVEIIIVNDNGEESSESVETREAIKRLREKFPRANLRYIEHRTNRNGAAARNTGLLASTGEFVAFLDDDDEYLPGRIAQSVEALKVADDQNVGAVYCGYLGWNSPKNDESRYPSGNLIDRLLQLDYKSHYLHTNTITFRRSALVSLNGFDETFRRHQDLELFVRFFQKFVVEPVKEPLVRLKPKTTDVDNRLFDLEFLRLKEQFLGRFSQVIDQLDPEVRATVYRTHWREAVRYVRDPKCVLDFLKTDVGNGRVQIALMLLEKASPK